LPNVTDESNFPPRDVWSDRNSFLNLAGAVEGGLVLISLLLAWLWRIDLWVSVSWDWSVLVISLLALVPLVALFGVTYRWPWGPLGRIKRILLEVMGPPLAACRWYDLPFLAGLAGLGEEMLFRGVLQTEIARWEGWWGGLVVTSILFGLVHPITPTYAVLAGVMGLFLGGLMYAVDPPNLLTPIVVHAAYDLIAFIVLRTDYRRRHDQKG
jgi:membrane protease YdiL (CAAX protease family)